MNKLLAIFGIVASLVVNKEFVLISNSSAQTKKDLEKTTKKSAKKISREEITFRAKRIVVDKLEVDETEVTESASFVNDLGIDSIDSVELIMELEKEFNIAIPNGQVKSIATFGDLVKYIEAMVK